MDRREYLGVGASIGAAAVSGCTGFLATAETPPPAVPEAKLESGGWAQTGETSGTVFEESYGPVTVEAVQHTVRYEDAALRQRVADRTLGQVDTALSVWFASRVDFSPNLDDLPGGVGQEQVVSQVRSNARDQFEQQMKSQGLTDVRKTGEGTIDIETGETAETVQLSAAYPFEGITFDVTEDESVEVPATDVGIEALLAVWHHGDYTLISGGAYPAENFRESIVNELSEGITVSVDIDLGLDPGTYREEVRSLVAGVE